MTQGDLIEFPAHLESSKSAKDSFFNGSPFEGLEKVTGLVTGHNNNDRSKKNGYSNISSG